MLGLVWFYVHYGTRPRFESALAGISAVVVVLIVQAIVQLSRSSLRSAVTIAIAVVALLGAIVSVHELIILVVGGLAAFLAWRFQQRGAPPGPSVFLVMLGSVVHDLGPVVATAGPVMLVPLFFVFLEIGAVLYGSGYVLYVFLESQLVQQRHWITEQQLVDAHRDGRADAGTGLHHRDVRRLPRAGRAGRDRRHHRHLPPGVPLRRRHRRRGPTPARQRRVPRFPQRRRRGVDRARWCGWRPRSRTAPTSTSAPSPSVRRPRRCSCSAVPIPGWLLLGGGVAGLLIPHLG